MSFGYETVTVNTTQDCSVSKPEDYDFECWHWYCTGGNWYYNYEPYDICTQGNPNCEYVCTFGCDPYGNAASSCTSTSQSDSYDFDTTPKSIYHFTVRNISGGPCECDSGGTTSSVCLDLGYSDNYCGCYYCNMGLSLTNNSSTTLYGLWYWYDPLIGAWQEHEQCEEFTLGPSATVFHPFSGSVYAKWCKEYSVGGWGPYFFCGYDPYYDIQYGLLKAFVSESPVYCP